MALPARAATRSVALGKLDPFWRFSAALGPYLETGQGLMEVPGYLMSGDFPYRKRPFPQEVLFADRLSVVRLLGGYLKKGVPEESLREQDLAWRDESGKIRYRMHLLKPRLQPYLDQGYREFTLVLDNVPYCFPAEPAAKGLGQFRPPRDPAEWKDFIREFAWEVVRIFGAEEAAKLRFRVGTENNGRERFDGTYQRFVRHYEDSAAAVLEIIPQAGFSFYNISGVSVKGIPAQNINSFALAEHCFAGGKQHVPVDFIAFSRYYSPNEDPEWHGQTCRAVWDEFGKRVPALKNVSREVQEFGTATWNMKKIGEIERTEPGAMGAAQLVQMIFRLREAGIRRLWHWGLLDTAIRDHKGVQRFFPTGQAWVYSILECMAGGEAFLAPIANRADGIKRLAVGSMKDDSAILMLSAYHPDGAARPAETIEFRMPGEAPKTSRVPRIVRLNASNCVHSLVREDLAAAGLLGADYVRSPRFLGNVREMAASRAGEVLAAGNEARYIETWTKSLTLRPLTPEDGTIEGPVLRLKIAPPEVVAVSL